MTKEQRQFWDRVEMAVGMTNKSKSQIAREAGCHRQSLLVNPKRPQIMSVRILKQFCKATGASADWLLGLEVKDEVN